MAIHESLEALLLQAGARFDVGFEPLDIDGVPLQVLGINNMQAHLDKLIASKSIHNPLKDLPLWAKVWPASFVLGRFLRKFEPQGKTVLEVGAGCGVTGCIAARYGFSHVTVSDIVPDALLFAKANSVRNGLQERMDVRHIDIATAQLPEKFDIIAASEMLYLDELHRPLLKFIERHLAAGGKAVLCTDWARRKPHFVKLAEKNYTVTSGHVGVRSHDAENGEQRRMYEIHIVERRA